MDPIPTGNQREITLTGMLMPWSLEFQTPLIMSFPDCDKLFIALFAEEEDLRSVLTRVGIPADSYSIKQIDEGTAFLESVRENHLPPLGLMVNLRFVEGDKQRYHEIDPNDPFPACSFH